MTQAPLLTILIPDGECHFTLPVATCLGGVANTRVHVISSDPAARVRHSRYCASFQVVENHAAARLEAVRSAVDRHGIRVILPVCENGARLLQRHRSEIVSNVVIAAIPGEEALAIASDKWRLAQFMLDRDIPHPPTVLYTADEAFERAIEAFAEPMLVKPRQGSGGEGIRAFDHREALLRYLETRSDSAGRLIVQAFIPGRDVDVSALCEGGEIVVHTTQRPRVSDPRGYEPATGIELVDHAGAVAVTRDLMRELAWNGIAHADLREDERDGSVHVLEINPRYWSSLLGSHAAGVNFPHLACLAAIGERWAKPRARTQRFVQAKASIAMSAGFLFGRGESPPAWRETMWPYLLADWAPYVRPHSRRTHSAGAIAGGITTTTSARQERIAEAA